MHPWHHYVAMGDSFATNSWGGGLGRCAFERRTAYTPASYYRLVEMSRSEIDQAAWEEGLRMTIDQAIDYALRQPL
jgi:hypothetical protein